MSGSALKVIISSITIAALATIFGLKLYELKQEESRKAGQSAAVLARTKQLEREREDYYHDAIQPLLKGLLPLSSAKSVSGPPYISYPFLYVVLADDSVPPDNDDLFEFFESRTSDGQFVTRAHPEAKSLVIVTKGEIAESGFYTGKTGSRTITTRVLQVFVVDLQTKNVTASLSIKPHTLPQTAYTDGGYWDSVAAEIYQQQMGTVATWLKTLPQR